MLHHIPRPFGLGIFLCHSPARNSKPRISLLSGCSFLGGCGILGLAQQIGIFRGGKYYEYRILVIPFVIIGVLFATFKGKAAKFVSGFNSFSKEEQALYDKAQISRDIRNQCFIWAVIMLAGALLSCFLTPYMAIPTYIVWLVLFFREVHFDNHKAFEKYLLK